GGSPQARAPEAVTVAVERRARRAGDDVGGAEVDSEVEVAREKLVILAEEIHTQVVGRQGELTVSLGQQVLDETVAHRPEGPVERLRLGCPALQPAREQAAVILAPQIG